MIISELLGHQFSIEHNTPLDRDTRQKSVFKIVHNDRPEAVKIYRKTDAEDNEQDRNALSIAELVAYETLRASPLAPYVPEPYQLVEKPGGDAIGLRVEWEDGEDLDEVTKPYPLLFAELKAFRHAVLNTITSGIYPNPEMLDPVNLIWHNASVPTLRFAECELIADPGRNYMRAVNGSLFELMLKYSRLG